MNEFLFGKSNWKAIGIGISLVFVVLVILSFVPVQSRGKHHTPLGRSKAQVRSLAQGVLVYAFEHDDQFPTQDQWPHELIELGIIESELLISPAEFEDHVSYHYVPSTLGVFGGDIETRIVIYEDPSHFEEGVVVGFADAQVRVIPHDQFEQMLADQLAEQSSEPEN